MLKRDCALKIAGIGFPHGTIRRQLNRGAGNKGSSCHNHLILIARHFPGSGRRHGIDGRTPLYGLAECDQFFRRLKLNGLNNIRGIARGVTLTARDKAHLKDVDVYKRQIV